MDDAKFQRWMKRVAVVELGPPSVSAGAIWWRAELRRRLMAETRATRPIRIVDGAASIVCAVVAGILLTVVGRIEVGIFAVMTAAILAGVGAMVLKKT